MSRKIVEVQNDYMTQYEVREAAPLDFREYAQNPNAIYEPMKSKYGHYQRSNVVLKNGTVVFEWMGWRNGGKAI